MNFNNNFKSINNKLLEWKQDATCKVATYGPAGRKLLIEKEQYWCVNCNFVFRVFSPFPAEYFRPEKDINYVLDKQKRIWECGKRDGYWRNK